MRPSVPANFCGVDESCIKEHVEPKGDDLDTALDIPLPEDSTDVLTSAVISQQRGRVSCDRLQRNLR